MRIVFLETESWEEQCLVERLSGHELQFFEGSLRESIVKRMEMSSLGATRSTPRRQSLRKSLFPMSSVPIHGNVSRRRRLAGTSYEYEEDSR